jgi:hypothetical protein
MQQQPDSSLNRVAPCATDASDENVERLRYLEHHGKRILLADVSACNEEQLAECIRAVPQYVTKQPEHSVLLLGDFTGTHFTKETIEQLKIATVFDRPHVARAAWVLSDNLHKVLLDSIRNFSAREIAVFATREEALDYLAS